MSAAWSCRAVTFDVTDVASSSVVVTEKEASCQWIRETCQCLYMQSIESLAVFTFVAERGLSAFPSQSLRSFSTDVGMYLLLPKELGGSWQRQGA